MTKMLRPYLLYALMPMVFSACMVSSGGNCKDMCNLQKFEVGFFNRAWERIDSLAQDSIRLEVVSVATTSHSVGAALDCDICQNRFTQSLLFSDRALRNPNGDILPSSTNLLDSAMVNQVGTGAKYYLNFFRATKLEKGTHTFTFKARMDGKAITATGVLWIPDSLGF